GVGSAASVPTHRASTPNSASARRTYTPKPSSPTFVMTAARRPRRAAATATLVGLPPRDFANVRTSANVTPICSGYRSTPTRPMVMTSGLGILPRERGALRDPAGRPRCRVGVEHHILLEDVPTAVARSAQVLEHVLDPGRAVAKWTVEAGADRVVVGHGCAADPRGERAVHILEVNVANARSRFAR